MNNAIKTHPPYSGELGYTDKTLIVPKPTYNNEIQKDFKIKGNLSFFIFVILKILLAHLLYKWKLRLFVTF